MSDVLIRFVEPSNDPLSSRLSNAREGLSGMFDGGELDALDADTRRTLRGLELFLLEARDMAFDVECAARLRQARRPRFPRWMQWGRL